MRHALIPINGSQINTSEFRVACGCAKTCLSPTHTTTICVAPETLELALVGRKMQASVCPRPLLGILAVTERDGLIAKKGPPRLPRPSASSRQVERHGGLGDAETEHQKLTMDPRRTPKEVLAGHLCDQLADFTGNPGSPAAPATSGSISPKR